MRYRLTLISETLWSHSSIYLNILYLLQRNANRFCVSQRRCQSFPADSATNSSNEFNRLFATRSVSKWILNRVEVPDVEPRRCRAISIDSNRVSVDIRVSGRPGRQAISRTDLPPSSAKSVFPFGKTRSKKSSFFVQLSRVCFFLRFYSRGWHQFSNEDVIEFFASFTRYTVTITSLRGDALLWLRFTSAFRVSMFRYVTTFCLSPLFIRSITCSIPSDRPNCPRSAKHFYIGTFTNDLPSNVC